MNYKVSRRLIFKWHKRIREGRESLENDFRSDRSVNVRGRKLAESLMDSIINDGVVQNLETEITSIVFSKSFDSRQF